MARREQFKMSLAERRRRTFSDNFKREKVHLIESGQVRISDICRQYEVSNVSVYRWLSKFGSMKKQKPDHLIVESKSDTIQLLELKKKVAELERIVGQKQVLLDFQDKMIQMAEEHYGIDIKKKYSGSLSNITGKTESK